MVPASISFSSATNWNSASLTTCKSPSTSSTGSTDGNDPDGRNARWQHSGFEVIYNLSNPNTDFLGSALYFEAVAGEDAVELEGKLLLQKNFGPLTVAYNLIVEAEFEGENFRDETSGELGQSLGVSYELSPRFSVGGELLHEIAVPDWATTRGSNFFAGPNASVRFGRAFVTATALFQLTAVDGEPDTQIRVVTGFDF